MENIEPIKDSIKLSVDKIINLIREVRNGLIKDFLKDSYLKAYFFERYDKPLSDIKIEFLKRDLKDLSNAPVDLVHYSGLIKQIKESNSASITERNEALFYNEIEGIFKKYTF